MTDDIVILLRKYAPYNKLHGQAADEIERLRAEVARLNTFLHPVGMVITREGRGENLTAKHMRHYNHCNCLDDASECCDPNCECHQVREINRE